MKVAVWHNLPSGGAKRALYNHVRGLKQRGHIVEAWCPSTADQSYLPLSEIIPEHVVPFPGVYSDVNRLTKIRKDYFELHAKIDILDSHCRQCAEEINSRGFDLLFANSCRYTSVSPIARYVTGPKVLYLQEPFRSFYEAMPKLPWVAPSKLSFRNPDSFKNHLVDALKVHCKRILAREELLNAQAFDVILVNSFFSRESILRAYGIDAKVCYLGIDSSLFENRGQHRESLVVGVGSLTPAKNIDFVIRALAKVDNPRPPLLWVGNASLTTYLTGLKHLASSLDVDFSVKEMATDAELVDILNRATMMAYAPRLEPFGFTPLEANACGLPVIATAEGGMRETIVDGVNGLLVEPDEQAMADAIIRLRDDEQYRSELSQSGNKQVAKKWGLSASIDRLEQRLQQVLSEKTSGVIDL